MLVPPLLKEQNMSIDSHTDNSRPNKAALKARKGKKQNSLSFRSQSPHQAQRNQQSRDNESVYSNASKNSKRSKAKQSSLGKIKIKTNQQSRPNVSYQFEEDRQSVRSTGSKRSHKSGKKQSSLNRPKIYKEEAKIEKEVQKMSFKDVLEEPQMIKIKSPLQSHQSPQVYRYNHREEIRKQPKVKEPIFSPFDQIQHNYSDQQPIYKLEEKKEQNKLISNKRQPQRVTREFQNTGITKKTSEVQQYQNIMESNSIINQSRMNQTKSRRKRDIFGKEKSVDNSSRLSGTIQQSVSGSALNEDSRRRSKGKLRQLLNKSKEKKYGQVSQLPSESHVQTFASQPRSNSSKKPTPNLNQNMRKIQLKKFDDEDEFKLQESVHEKSANEGLQFSMSHNNGNAFEYRQKDSLVFQLEPEKKKGLSITSQRKKQTTKNEEQSSKNLYQLKNPILESKQRSSPNRQQDQMIKIPNNLVSKQLEGVSKILRQNEEYFTNSGVLDFSRQSKIENHRQISKQKEQLPFAKLQIIQQKQVKPIKKVERIEKPSNYKEKKKQVQEINKWPIQEQEILKKQKVTELVLQNNMKQNLKSDFESKPKDIPLQANKKYSTFSIDSQAKSEKSNGSQTKKKGKKQSSLKLKKPHKVQAYNLSPRGEDSFYEQGSKHSSQQKEISRPEMASSSVVDNSKKVNILSFPEQEENIYDKPKSRTDVNFYEMKSQKSNKPPSSRPPLSRKSNDSSSKSKSKIKENTLPISMNKKEKIGSIKSNEVKKMSLLEKAQMANGYSSQQSYSQDGSFYSRQSSQNSRTSNYSKNSKGSKKESSLNNSLKDKVLKNALGKPPTQKKRPSNQYENSSQEYEHFSREEYVRPKVQERPIVSKNCTYIDQHGRLVSRDLVIRGEKTYGRPTLQDSEKKAFQRMRRSRQNHRSRSNSRQRGKNSLSRKTSNQFSQSQSYYNDSSNTSSYYNTKNSYYQGDSNNNNNQRRNNDILRQFIKPVQQVPIYYNNKNQNKDNQMQNRSYKRNSKKESSRQLDKSNVSRKSLHRTQRSGHKRR